MSNLQFPTFGEENVIENQLNSQSRVLHFPEREASAFHACCQWLIEQGFEEKESRIREDHFFASFLREGTGIFLNYFGGTKEMRIVEEQSCAHFSFADQLGDPIVSPQITQLTLEDFGMSYAIRLSDGRFILLDGGRNLAQDADRLYECLKAGCTQDRPRIAAWIFSHPHSDHFHCFISFMEKYAPCVDIERFLFNFPDHDDFAHYPVLENAPSPIGNLASFIWIPRMLEWIEKTGAPIFTPHTGQRFTIGDAEMEILSSMDDTIHLSHDINAISLVIKMQLGGQTILWTTDAGFSYARLAQRYGEYLKSDILQIPHHGFQSGTAEGELAGYRLIRPRVCLLPASDFTAFSFFCAYRAGARFLMEWDEVAEFITGSQSRTLTLPYTPAPNAKEITRRMLAKGQNTAGANTWVFTGLSTARPEDFVFTLLNTVIPPAHVQIDLYFEQKARAVRYIQTEIGGSCFKTLNIVGEEVDGDAMSFNAASLKVKGVPENQPFAVRFTSETPIIVSHPDHAPAYHSAF
ncbi:MAG: hypothetical protein E7336_05690 [Clostridiales bacterium]|nr:hypothetical protein [Clostridiales bacterium]